MKDLIKQALIEHKMSQKELAEKIFVTPQAVSKWVSGESQPTVDNIKYMSDLFGYEFGQKLLQKGKLNRNNTENKHHRLEEIDTFEKATWEAKILVENIELDKYSHAVNKLLNWLVSSVIGLTYHQLINTKNCENDICFDDIFYNLNNYFEECYRNPHSYKSQLEYDFFLMNGDLFESFGPYELVNHKYAESSVELWFRFRKTIDVENNSSLYNEFKVALMELITKHLNK